MNFQIAPSSIDYNVYFLFRNDGTEIRIEIVVDKLIRSSQKLKPEEVNYIKSNIIIFKSIKSTEKTIKELRQLGYNDRHIADSIGKSLYYVSRITK